MRKFINDLIKRKTTAHNDFLIIILISTVILSLAVYFDLFDRFVFWYVQQEEPFELEEIIIVIFLSSFAFAIFSWRRWRELIVESMKRQETEELLRQERDRLKDALEKVKTLRGFIPICSTCKKIRDDKGFWHQVEVYVRDNTDATFSHGICPDCLKRLYPDFIEGGTNTDDQHI